MAIVFLRTLCAILSVLHASEAVYEGNLCLETITKFIHDQSKCNFDQEYALDLMKDNNVTCQTRCLVTIGNMNSYNRYMLRRVNIRFGYQTYMYFPCTCSFSCPLSIITIDIYCLAWNKVHVPVGGYCTQNEQCQGSNSGVCEHGRCVCRTGYILFNLECHAGNLALNQPCSFNEQCAGSPYASCLERYCSCIEGYTAMNSTNCVKIKVPVGGNCNQDEQCQGRDHVVACELGRCVCRPGYVLYNLECYTGNLALNQSCYFGEQCTGSPYTSCLGEKCSCIEGYTAKNSTGCAQIKVFVGGSCKQNEQCQGSRNSGLCKHERCVCKAGYVQISLECHEGNLALNQSCSFSEQCAGSPYASCLRGKCSFIEGYTTENSTKCVQGKEFTLPGSLQNNQEEAKIGTTLGALFGGLFLGVVITTVVVVIINRRFKTLINKREEPTVAFGDNNRYSLAKIVDHGTFQNIQTKNEKREVSPYACSEETRIYDNVNRKPRNGQTQEAVYNHLHEQVKQDDDDYYDHACAASAHIGDMGDYSHVQHTTS